jgi:RCR-type E3 ubiquitin transferase
MRMPDDQYRIPPGPILLKEEVVQIACGLHHTVMLTKNGEVYTCGSNLYGQLGLGNTTLHRGIVKLQVPLARQIAAGSQHTVILTKSGEVYTLGSNNVSFRIVNVYTNVNSHCFLFQAGQLARTVGDDDVVEAWGSEPAPVSNLGPGFGFKAIWVGASGDSTFLNVEKALINMQILQQSTVISNKENISKSYWI